jgi:phosphopantetheinyl transferase
MKEQQAVGQVGWQSLGVDIAVPFSAKIRSHPLKFVFSPEERINTASFSPAFGNLFLPH